MSLILHALSNAKHSTASDQVITHEFKQHSGSIGRSQNNDWVLADTQKYLSGQHALIEYRDHQYILTDTSTNGVFHNQATQAIGKGCRIHLSNGDTLRMGIYDIDVSISDISDNEQTLTPSDNAASSDPFADISDEFSIDNAAIKDVSIDADDPFQDMWQDDFIAADSAKKSALSTADVMDEHFKPISIHADTNKTPSHSASAIINTKEHNPFTDESENVNDDWDEDWFDDLKSHSDNNNSNDHPDNNILSTANKQTDYKDNHANKQADEDWFQQDFDNNAAIDDFFIDNEIEASQKEDTIKRKSIKAPDDNQPSPIVDTVVTSKPNPTITADINTSVNDVHKNSQDAMRQFIAGLQLDDADMEQKVLENLDFKQIGTLFKTSIQGTLDILHSRTQIKNEMRMDVTTIQPIENNPLKFSISVDEALVRLLVPQKNSYLAPKYALEEAYNDIRAHQIAVISGIQATLNYMLKRFEPNKLTTRLQKKSPIAAVIPLHRKAKLWALFEDLYATLQEEAEDDFNRLFSLEFSKAYDQQIDRLKQQMAQDK